MKSFYLSKTVYLGLLNIAVGIGLLTLGNQELGGGFILNGLAIIGLRFKTNTGVSLN